MSGQRITLDTSDLLKKVEGLANYGKILSPAFSKTKQRMGTELSTAVREVYAIKKGEFDSTTNVKYTVTPPSIIATTRSKPLTLSRFMVGSFIRGKPIKVQVKKGKRVPLSPSTFAATLSGNTQIARRKGKSRLPIEVLRTLSTAQMVTNAQVEDRVIQNAYDFLMKEIERQHARFLQKGGGK